MAERRKETGYVRVQRIINRSRYGLYKTQLAMQDAMLDVWDFDAMEDQIAAAAEATGSEALLDDMFEVSAEKVNELTGVMIKLFEDVYDKASKKVMDLQGNDVDAPGLNYKSHIESLARDQLGYVKDISETQKSKMLDKLQDGVKQGKTAGEIGKEAADEIKGLTETRTKRIARSELTKASNDAMQTKMEAAGIEEYVWIAATTAKKKPCKVCRDYHRTKHKVGRGPMPVKDSHPNCRCVTVAAQK